MQARVLELLVVEGKVRRAMVKDLLSRYRLLS